MPIKSRIRTVPHYPKPGVMFRDITTLLKDPVGFRVTIHELVNRYTGMKIDKPGDVEPALRDAFGRKDDLVFMDFIIDPKENVYPMIPAGAGQNEMILV